MSQIATALISSMQALTGAIEAETGRLQAGDFPALPAAAAAKQQAAAGYEAAMKALAAAPGIATKLPELTRRDLRAAARRLELALSDNTRMVTAMRTASARLVGRIMEAASQHSAAAGYTATGALAVEPAAISGFRERV